MSSPAESAVTGNAGPPEDLLESIRAELRKLRLSSAGRARVARKRRTAPAKRLGPERTATRKEERARRPAPVPKAAVSRPARNRGPTIAVVVCIVVVLAAGFVVFYFVRSGIQERNLGLALRRVQGEERLLQTWLAQGDEFRGSKDFPKALVKFSAVVSKAEPLLLKLRNGAAGLGRGDLRTHADAAIARIGEFLKDARERLSLPEIEHGGRGKVQYERKWVTLEEKERLVAEQMRAQGKEFWQGAWRTEEEIHQLRGEVLWGGKWMAKAERDKRMKEKAKPAGTDVAAKPPARPPTTPPQEFNPSTRRWVLDDFEKSVNWAAVPWKKTNPCTLKRVAGPDTYQLEITLTGGTYDKSAIVKRLRLDFRSRRKLAIDIENQCGEPVGIAIALETDKYYESHYHTLKLGKNRDVMFNIKSADFKCGPHWTHSAKIQHWENAGWLYLLIYSDRPGKILIDNVVALGSQ